MIKINFLCIEIIVDSHVNVSTYRDLIGTTPQERLFNFLNLQFSCNQFGCRLSLRSFLSVD